MHIAKLILLYDYYGNLLTDRQRICFEMRYNLDYSLSEIGREMGISRQAVHDNLARTEALLINMEEKTGCVHRDQLCRKMLGEILVAAIELRESPDYDTSAAAQRIISAAEAIKE